MATATRTAKARTKRRSKTVPIVTVSPKRRTKPGEVKARQEKFEASDVYKALVEKQRLAGGQPAPISLPQLEWIATDDKGVVHRHLMDNPIQKIVNNFNAHYSLFGVVATLPPVAPPAGPYAVVFIPDLTGDQPENLIEVPGFGLQTLEMDEQSFAAGERLFFSTRGEAFTEAANLNATQTANPYYWNVVVEVGVGCAFLSVDLDSDGHGTFDAHAIPYSIVKPTDEERAMYGQRKGGAH